MTKSISYRNSCTVIGMMKSTIVLKVHVARCVIVKSEMIPTAHALVLTMKVTAHTPIFCPANARRRYAVSVGVVSRVATRISAGAEKVGRATIGKTKREDKELTLFCRQLR